MSTPNLLVRLAITLVVIWLAGREGIPGAVAQTGDVAVVVNDKNPVDSLSRPELRKIFAGEKRSWPGSLPIKLFVRTPGARERATLLRLLGMSESEYKEYWSAKVFRGEAQTEPNGLPSNGMQKEAIAAYPGAVALVNIQDVKPGMKVVKVEGHKPGEAGYPLN